MSFKNYNLLVRQNRKTYGKNFLSDFFLNSTSRRKMPVVYREQKTRLKLILKLVGKEQQRLQRKLRILDIGCADGFISEKIKLQGNEVYGIDILKEAVTRAKKRGINAYLMDLEANQLNFPVTFDLVLIAEVIEHLYDPQLLIRKIIKILKPEGIVIITTPNLANFTDRIRFLLGRNPANSDPLGDDFAFCHIRAFTLKTLKDLLTGNGFRIETVTSNIFSIHRGTSHSKRPLFTSLLLGKLLPSLGEYLFVVARKNEK